MLRRLRICAPMGLSLLLLPAMAYALDGKIDGKPVPEWQVAVDTVWTIVAGILVFLMQAGFAMVEGGFTRAKNVANIMMKNIGDFSMASLGFWILGFGIMFGNGNSFLGTTGFFVAAGTGDLYSSLSWTSVPTLTAWFFQLVFCATAATIVSGAMAERTRFSAYLIFSFIISLIFYSMVGALDLGRWMAGGVGHAGFRRLDGGPFHRCVVRSRRRHRASVASHKYGYEDARAFWLSARRDDEQWRAPREEEQRSRRPKGPADS